MLHDTIVFADLTCIPNNDVFKQVPASAHTNTETTAACESPLQAAYALLTHSSSRTGRRAGTALDTVLLLWVRNNQKYRPAFSLLRATSERVAVK